MVRRAGESAAGGGPLTHWIFGYGSVIWNPGFPFVEKKLATARGWSRRFWQGSTDHRGVPGAPGRVVTLVAQPEGHCIGLLYRVLPEDWDPIIARLDVREQGGYTQEWLTVETADGEMQCLAYVARSENSEFLGDGPAESLATQIASAAGPSGPNREYLYCLADSLRELAIEDPHIFELERLVRALPTPG